MVHQHRTKESPDPSPKLANEMLPIFDFGNIHTYNVMPKVSFVEYHLRHPEKVAALSPEAQKLYWQARRWHPMVRMQWTDSIESDGKGALTFPDGSKHLYNGSHDPSG
jgi:hypothetical protein